MVRLVGLTVLQTKVRPVLDPHQRILQGRMRKMLLFASSVLLNQVNLTNTWMRLFGNRPGTCSSDLDSNETYFLETSPAKAYTYSTRKPRRQALKALRSSRDLRELKNTIAHCTLVAKCEIRSLSRAKHQEITMPVLSDFRTLQARASCCGASTMTTKIKFRNPKS